MFAKQLFLNRDTPVQRNYEALREFFTTDVTEKQVVQATW